jgi:predicted outer membrane protein
LPKEVNFSKTFAGRLASKTLQLNNSLQHAVETKVATITGQTLSERASRYLQSISKQAERRKKYQQSAVFKNKRRKNRARLEHEYHTARSGTLQDKEDEYVKGQLDGP